MQPVVTLHGPFVEGAIVDRPNRFTVTVRIDGTERRAYLRNTGGMETVLAPDRPIRCRPVDDPDRKTAYDAVAVRVDDVWVTVDATLPNRIVDSAIDTGQAHAFSGATVLATEPPLPDGGRADFRIRGPGDRTALVEVKSNTYVVDGISKFPDRPTARGRRQVAALTDLVASGDGIAHVVFVIQRPDVVALRPFREVDPAFADRLREASDAGVHLHAWSTRFDPPTVSLVSTSVPIELDE